MWTLVGEDRDVSPSKSHLVEENQNACACKACKDDQCGRQHDQLVTRHRLRTHRN